MKLLELIPQMREFSRIRRKGWDCFLVKSQDRFQPLLKLDLHSLQIGRYCLTMNDLESDDWEIIDD